MTLCSCCSKPYGTQKCTDFVYLDHHGKVYDPIKVGDSSDFYEGDPLGTSCVECGAEIGSAHHAFCDNERCPVCLGQLLSCNCIPHKKRVIKE